MKSISDFLYENLVEGCEIHAEDEESVVDEKTFKAWAKAKFEEVFGDELDKKKMNDTIKGLLDDNKDLVEKGEWGELVGMMNKSFAD